MKYSSSLNSRGKRSTRRSTTPFAPNEPVDAVLEVNAGFVANHGINVGDAGDY